MTLDHMRAPRAPRCLESCLKSKPGAMRCLTPGVQRLGDNALKVRYGKSDSLKHSTRPGVRAARRYPSAPTRSQHVALSSSRTVVAKDDGACVLRAHTSSHPKRDGSLVLMPTVRFDDEPASTIGHRVLSNASRFAVGTA